MIGNNKKEKIAVLFATWFYSGLIPPPRFLHGAAGTYGSFFSLPLCFLYAVLLRLIAVDDSLESVLYGALYQVSVFVVIGHLAWICAGIAERVLGPMTDWHGHTKVRDQNQIVIDETVGMLLACWPIGFFPIDLWSWEAAWLFLIGFILFRIFDIIKLWPANVLDRRQDVFGVIMDDYAAGAQAALILIAIYAVFF